MQTFTQSFFDNSIYKWRTTQTNIDVLVEDLTAKSNISNITTNDDYLYKPQLADDITESPVYATLEQNEYFLDGSVSILPDTITNEQIGWWTTMADEDGYFGTNPTIEIDFTNYHSSIGLTLYYDLFSYPLETKITWFSGNVQLEQETYTLTGSVQTIDNPVNNYNKIIIEYTKAKPYAFIKLFEINYGVTLGLTGEQLQGASLTEQVSLLSNQLAPDELTFNIINYDGQYDILNPHDLLTYFKKGQVCRVKSGVLNRDTDEYEYMNMGKFYIDNFSSMNGVITLNAYGVLNQLNNEMFYSEFFENKTAEYIVSKILDSYEYYIHPNVKDIILNGYIPLGTKKEALKTLAICCNAVVKEGRDGKIYIYQPTEELSSNQIIADDTVYHKYGLSGLLQAGVMAMPSIVEPEPYVLTITRNQRLSQIQATMIGYYHKVEVNYNSYLQTGNNETLFNGEVTTDGEGVAIIKYNAPVYNLEGTTGDFTLYHYADCSVLVGNSINTTYQVTITGSKYTIDTALISATKEINDNAYDESRLTMTLDSSNELLTLSQAKECANWYLSQLQKRKDVSFDWWSVCGVEASDYCKLITSYDEEYTMEVSEIKYDLNTLIANVKGVL